MEAPSGRSQSKLGRTGQRSVYMATAQDSAVMTMSSGRCETSSCDLASALDLPAPDPSEAAAVFSKRQIKAEMKLQTDGRKETKQKKREKTDGERRWGASICGHKAEAAEKTWQWE